MEKTKAEIEQLILEFLAEHGEEYFTCAIATCIDNEPRNTPIDARNDGLNMYFSADPGGKLANIRKNPKVCLAVFIPVGKLYMKNARGFQMWGTAHIIDREKEPEEFQKAFDIIRLEEIAKVSTGHPFPEAFIPKLNLVKIVPDKISYFVSMGEKPAKYFWNKEDV
jgi:hypothetical protein